MAHSSATAGLKVARGEGRKVITGVISQVLNTSGEVADHPKENLYLRDLDVPPRFPPGRRVGAQPEEMRQIRLREIKLFAHCSDLIRRKQAVAPSMDGERIFTPRFEA